MNKFKFLTAWQLLRNRVRTVNFRKGSPERQLVADFAITFGGVYLFMTSVVGITICVGPSMLPTIDAAGELAFVDRLSYKLDMKDYKIGDVVISKSMDDPRKSENELD